MKRYTMSFAAACEHRPEHLERTARKDSGDDVCFAVWTSRAAMVQTVRMQERRASRAGDWRPCVALTSADYSRPWGADSEGREGVKIDVQTIERGASGLVDCYPGMERDV